MSYPAVRRWLVEHTSLEPSLLDGAGFESLVAERLRAAGSESETAYVEALDGSVDEVDRLTGGIAVPETWFFRYSESFRVLGEFLSRRLQSGAGWLRMMSVGCASGEEPYSMAMTALHAGWEPGAITIEALDRSQDVLRRAGSGEYGAFSVRTEVPAWALAYLHRAGDSIVVDPGVRSLVRFVRADVVQPGALAGVGPCDVIFCRNVLIYLGAEARVRLLDAVCAALAPGGLLFVGHAEPLLCGASPLRAVAVPHTFALERTGGVAAPVNQPARVSPARVHARPGPAPVAATRPAPPEAEPTLKDARDLADAGRPGESERVLRTIIARRGPSAPALELLGVLRMGAADAAGARVLFEQAIYLEPARPVSLLQLALLSERAGDARRASLLWDRARRASAAEGEEHLP